MKQKKLLKNFIAEFFTVACALALILCLVSCKKNEPKAKTFYTYFDTVISIISYGNESQKQFYEHCSKIETMLDKYNRMFDIYHEYSGMNNLCTVNNNAGKKVIVDSEIIELLELSKHYYEITGGEVNIMLGPVLKQWHSTITETKILPDFQQLKNSEKFASFDYLKIDKANSTVQLKDSKASLDVGAIAKGFATEKVAQYLEKNGCTSYAINAGGNVRLIGKKTKDSDWSVAIRNPNDNDAGYSMVLLLNGVSCVTSGVYERNVVIDGKEYHHIIDKDSLMPADYFASVSVVCKDSAFADALSTALFCMSYEEGLKLVTNMGDVEAVWIYSDGTINHTEGLKKYIYED